jgi:transmembrane sensor
MQNKDFTSLLNRYLAGQASEEEEAQLAQFFEQSGDSAKDTRLSASEQDRMFASFSESPRFREIPVRNSLRRLRSWPAAAASLLVIASALAWLLLRNTTLREKAIVYKEVKTGKGQLLTVLLPDSTEITLNANSTLRYHPRFAEVREVMLTGEALFKVHNDPAHPFRINTGDSLLTEVLGTAFNINSYENQPNTRVTVLSGRVRVQHGATVLGILSQQQALAYDRDTRSSTGVISAANAATSWTRGEWIYDGMTIADLQSLLNNYYGITVKAGKTFTTSASMNFHKRQDAREIVSIFCAVTGCQYKWTDATTVILF